MILGLIAVFFLNEIELIGGARSGGRRCT